MNGNEKVFGIFIGLFAAANCAGFYNSIKGDNKKVFYTTNKSEKIKKLNTNNINKTNKANNTNKANKNSKINLSNTRYIEPYSDIS